MTLLTVGAGISNLSSNSRAAPLPLIYQLPETIWTLCRAVARRNRGQRRRELIAIIPVEKRLGVYDAYMTTLSEGVRAG
jgi:hypothetical protein